VNVAARMRRSVSTARPSSSRYTREREPGGAPALARASTATAAVRRDSSGWPGLAFTTTGQPAASAAAVSVPATENANGKLDAAKTTTGPIGTRSRRSAGRGAGGQSGRAGSVHWSSGRPEAISCP